MNTNNVYVPRKEIDKHTWWKYQDKFTPPLVGPYDYRINNKTPAETWLNLKGIPRILKTEKCLEHAVQKQLSAFEVFPESIYEFPNHYRSFLEDQEELRLLQKKIKKIIH